MTVHTILSGGLDSTTALAWALDTHPDQPHRAVSFDYGQRHRDRELAAAGQVAAHYGVRHTVRDIAGFLSGGALLGAVEVPEGHYAEDSMAATVVNGRNLLFASVTIAGTRPGDTVVTGVHAGDHPVYADCRPGFWLAVSAAAAAYDVAVLTPFVEKPKAEVVQVGHRLSAPLGLTWSCYNGGAEHCGRCGTCVERAEAFHLAGIPDPTVYTDPTFWREATA